VLIVYANRICVRILFSAVFTDVEIALHTTVEIHLLRELFRFASPLTNIAPKADWVLKQSPCKILHDMALVIFINNSVCNSGIDHGLLLLESLN
jgi:hypothetical protein